MSRLLCTLLTTVALAAGLAALPTTTRAQPAARAYAPENLRTLSHQDQVRVISLEYSEQSRGRRIPDDQLRFYLDQVNRSNWTFSRIRQDIAASLAGGGNRDPRPPHGGHGIRCESDRHRPQTCTTPWQGPSRLLRQLSDTRCVEGHNWNSVPGRIHVQGGCRAEFGPGQDWSGSAGREIRCESLNNRYRECAIAGAANARLVRQLSDTACIEGRTWGTRGNLLWVNGGCRGVFVADGHGGGPGGYSISCASENNHQQTCAWNNRYGRPYLQRQLSSSPCREGSTWGHRGNTLWVSNGCRGLFGAR